MAELFSEEWMNAFKDRWNGDRELAEALEKIRFDSIIGYGFDGEDNPRGFLRVENGRAIEAGAYRGQPLDWDLRATPENWKEWLDKPPGMMGLGMAYTARKLKFNVGDYAAMIRDPRMAGPFVRSFAAMSG